MDHATALKIARAYKPELVFADQHDQIPDCLVASVAGKSIPFSIHVPTDLRPEEPEAAQREEEMLKRSLDAAAKHFGL